MKIKQVAQKLQITQKTIRYYEEQGIISPKLVDKNGRNFREYSEEDVKKLQMIVELRKFSFSVREIQTIFEHPESLEQIYQEKAEMLKAQLEYDYFLMEIFNGIKIAPGDKVDEFFDKLTESKRRAVLKSEEARTVCGRLDDTFDDGKFTKWERRQEQLREASKKMFVVTICPRMKYFMTGDMPW